MMAFIGVRISWLMLARNSLLARLRRLGRFLGLAQLGLRPFRLGDVPEYDHPAMQCADFVA